MKKIKFLAMMLFAIVACAGFVSCGDDDDEFGGLVGTWESTYSEGGYVFSEVITFTAQGTCSGTYTETNGSYTDTDYSTGTYSVDGNLLTTTWTDGDGDTWTESVVFNVDGDALTVVNSDGDAMVYHRVG